MFYAAPDAGVHQIVLADEILVFLRQEKMFHHAFIVLAKDAVALVQRDFRVRGRSRLSA